MMLVLILMPIFTQSMLSRTMKQLLQPRRTQYLILASYPSKNHNRIDYSSRISDQNKQIMKEHQPNTSLSQAQHDIKNVDITFKKQYQYNKTLELSITNNSLTKNDIMSQIADRFNDNSYGNTILYYTGSAQQHNGAWIICPQKQQYSQDCLIYYQDIVQAWKNRTDNIASRHLLLILETSYAGIWLNHCYLQVDFEDMSIMAATNSEEKAYDIGYGGYFTYNLMQSIRIFKKPRHLREKVIEDSQHMVSIGIGALLDRIFALRIFYTSWDQIFTQGSHMQPGL